MRRVCPNKTTPHKTKMKLAGESSAERASTTRLPGSAPGHHRRRPAATEHGVLKLRGAAWQCELQWGAAVCVCADGLTCRRAHSILGEVAWKFAQDPSSSAGRACKKARRRASPSPAAAATPTSCRPSARPARAMHPFSGDSGFQAAFPPAVAHRLLS